MQIIDHVLLVIVKSVFVQLIVDLPQISQGSIFDAGPNLGAASHAIPRTLIVAEATI